jgi:small subunit ribosomal protein S17
MAKTKKTEDKKIEEKKESKIVETKTNGTCKDINCPMHGSEPLKLRGRIFEGTVIKKAHKRVVIEFERVLYLSKFERYEKRKTKLHARLPECLDSIKIGDLIKIAECRPLSKIKHFVAIEKIKDAEENK